jgi:hypothetical protein
MNRPGEGVYFFDGFYKHGIELNELDNTSD